MGVSREIFKYKALLVLFRPSLDHNLSSLAYVTLSTSVALLRTSSTVEHRRTRPLTIIGLAVYVFLT